MNPFKLNGDDFDGWKKGIRISSSLSWKQIARSQELQQVKNDELDYAN